MRRRASAGRNDPSAPGGDAYGTHRALEPPGALPQPAWRLDNDFTRLFRGEMLVAVETLNIDAASFAQMEEAARQAGRRRAAIAGKLHTSSYEPSPSAASSTTRSPARAGCSSGGSSRSAAGAPATRSRAGDRVATLVSLSLTPLRIDRVRAVRRASAQIDVDGEAVLFASGAYAKLPRRPARAPRARGARRRGRGAAGRAPRAAPGHVVVVLGAGGKSGVLCAAEARRRGGPSACVDRGRVERSRAAEELRALGLCDAVVVADARDAVAVRAAVLEATGGREADVTLSCVNVPDAEMAAILVTRDRGVVYFFAMSTSFTRAALGAEGVGKDVDLFIGNGYAHGHAEHTLALLRDMPAVRALFETRYG